MDSSTPPPSADSTHPALHVALAGLMASVARLAVAQGMSCAEVEELLRLAFVQAASEAHPGLPEHRKVSRISTTTGLNRREVSRLVQLQQARQSQAAPAVTRSRSVASEVFTHWRSQRPYLGEDGQPRVLPRLGPAPSFESLAQAVTRDVHARSLLDELCRLGLAEWDPLSDTVRQIREGFVAHGDLARQLAFLGDNVGDHLRAAVANTVGGSDRAHFEQAIFADGLSAESVTSVRPAVRQLWQTLLQNLVPALEARVKADATLRPAPQGRLRVGLYTYHEGAEPPPAPRGPARPRAPRRN